MDERPDGDVDEDGRDDDGDLQERLESSRAGRWALSVVIAVVLIGMGTANFPTSHIRTALATVVAPPATALGIEQGWTMFAPNPRQNTAFLRAEVQGRDGRVTPVPIPLSVGVAEYWDYRWQKVGESLLFDPTAVSSWAPYCRWVADRNRRAGGDPVQVTLVSRAAETNPPGPGPERGPWVEKAFYTLRVAP